MPQKLTTTTCFIQEESSGGKEFRKQSCELFLCSRRKPWKVSCLSIRTAYMFLKLFTT